MSRPYQMRRHARRMRRYGLQPMVVITSGDRLPDVAAVVIGRWVWRYRSELAPAVVALATVVAAWLLHATRPQWWPVILAATGVAAAALGSLGRHVGLIQASERLYAAVVVAATGGWLAAGVALSPWHAPLPRLLLAAPVLALPWWAHRRRRARVRVERTLAVWPQIAEAVDLKGSRVLSAVVDVWGWRARFALARGHTIDDVRAKIPALESALGVVRGAVRVFPTRDDLAHRFELRVLETDPHAEAIPWPGPSVTTISDPVELGPFDDAAPARVLLQRRHVLIGGATGSGKSGGVNVIMGNLSACPDVVVWGIDLKRGMELQPWAPCLDRLATTPEHARILLRDGVAVLEARAALLAETGKRLWEPSPDMPALVIVIDEYAELADDAPEAMTYTDSIARLGRAVAETLIAATQRPTQKVMGRGAVRSQMDVRISFRVREQRDVDLILGQGALKAGWHADKLNAPGKFLISAPEHDTPRRARAYLVTDQAVSEVARRHAGIRPALDAVSRRALDQAHTQGHAHSGSEPLSGARGPRRKPEHAEHGSGAAGAPEALLWAALEAAPEEGVSVPQLVKATGKSRRWVYYRLNEYARTGRAVQTARGQWRAIATDPNSP